MKLHERILLILIMISSPVTFLIGLIEWLIMGKSKIFNYISRLTEKAIS